MSILYYMLPFWYMLQKGVATLLAAFLPPHILLTNTFNERTKKGLFRTTINSLKTAYLVSLWRNVVLSLSNWLWAVFEIIWEHFRAHDAANIECEKVLPALVKIHQRVPPCANSVRVHGRNEFIIRVDNRKTQVTAHVNNDNKKAIIKSGGSSDFYPFNSTYSA